MATNNTVSSRVTEQVVENVKTWLNTCTLKPFTFSYEDLPANDAGICLSSRQTAYYLKRYIMGGYKAQYQFQLIYRILPTSDTETVDAIELLNSIADWCEDNASSLVVVGTTVAQKITKDTNASVLAVYEDGARDYDVSLTLTWEVL